MAYQRKSLTEIYQDLESKANSTILRYPTRRDLFLSLIKTLAGASHGWYGSLDYILKQCFTTTADAEGLQRQGADFGIFQKPATFCSGTVKFSYVTENEIKNVPIGTILTASNGAQYSITTATTTDGKADFRALDAGSFSNLNTGDNLTLSPTVAGVNGAVVQADNLILGIDEENLESYRARILFRKQNSPGCGTVADYIFWATSIEGVTRAWCQRHTPVNGQITVRIMTDGLTPDGLPTELKLQEVQEYIDSVSPTEATVFVVQPVKKEVTIKISNLEPATVQVQNLIKQRLQDLFLSEASLGKQINLSRIISTIDSTSGLSYFTLDSPTTDLDCLPNELLILSGVDFV